MNDNFQKLEAFQLMNSEMENVLGGGLWSGWHKLDYTVIVNGVEKTIEQRYNWFHLHGTQDTRTD
jgi:hypothetical protein